MIELHEIPAHLADDFAGLLETARQEYLDYSDLVGTLISDDAVIARQFALTLRDGTGAVIESWTEMKRQCSEAADLVNWTYTRGTKSGDQVGRALGELFSLFSEVRIVTQPERKNSLQGWRPVNPLRDFWMEKLHRHATISFQNASGELAARQIDERSYNQGFPLPASPFLVFMFDGMRFMDAKAADPRQLRSLAQEWPKVGRASHKKSG